MSTRSKGIGWALDWNGDRYLRDLRAGAARGLRTATKRVVEDLRQELSGPAGSPEGGPPGRVDGDLVRAVKGKVRSTRAGVSATIGVMDDPTQMAKAARLAGGMHGRDALGRFYSQGPRPFLPAVMDRNAGMIVKAMFAGIESARMPPA